MTDHRFILTRYDPDQPWIMRTRDHMSVRLEDGTDFPTWARDRFPRSDERVEIDRAPADRETDATGRSRR